MLLIGISILVAMIGITVVCLANKETTCGVGCGTFIVGLFFACIFSVPAICANVHEDYQFQSDYIKYEVLQAQVNSNEFRSLTLTEDIIEYNKTVANYRYYHDSPWVGVFYYDGCENLPYITIDESKGE